jgi:gliding motility-associated-like protein
MKLFYIFFFFLICHSASAQFWIQHGSGNTNNMAYAIAADNSGNTYSAGYFSTSITFGMFTLSGSGPIDMFIMKTDPNGAIVWVKRAGGANVTEGLSIAVNSNALIVTGFFYGSADFDAQTITSNGQQDIFLAKYDLNGNLQWAVNAGGSLDDVGNKVSFDSNGNILVTGEFASSNFNAGSHNLNSLNNSIDVFIAKFDPAGNCLWAKSGTSIYIDRGTQITSDDSGNVYVAGEFSDTVQFDVIHDNVMYNALFLIKYDPNGNEQWFRWFGSGNTVKMKGLEITSGGDLILLGNYTSALYYFGFNSSFTLTSPFINNYFLSKLTTGGDLLWSVTDGSNAAMSSECLAIKPNQEITVGGTYQCRFDGFSNRYGQGVFCSLGYNDCFVANYDNNGSWLSARCYGGNKMDYLFGLAADNQNRICLAGAFCKNIFFAETNTTFLGFPGPAVSTGINYCGDNDYFGYIDYHSSGNSDVYVGKPMEFSRQVLDFFDRNPGACNREFRKFCIENCMDTINACNNVLISPSTYTPFNFRPEFHYLWNTGDTIPSLGITTSGIYSITITSYDGCFSDEDSVYVDIHPNPSIPPISDNKGINNNSLNPDPILLCNPDSVLLSSIAPTSGTFEWAGISPADDSVMINISGNYTFIVTDTFGCMNQNNVDVIISDPLDLIDPKIICLNDTDRNDTISICSNEKFVILVYDTLSNPVPNPLLCIPQQDQIKWLSSDLTLDYLPVTDCNSGPPNIFSNLTQSGWYQIDAHLVRDNSCARDSFDLSINIYIIVNPAPVFNLTTWITGNTFICPGTSTTLYAHGDAVFTWTSSAGMGDSCIFSQAENSSLNCQKDSLNQFGCRTVMTSDIPISITSDPLPQITVLPPSALICPYDSVQLSCSGTGSFNWMGPGGAIASTASSIYVTTSGYYYCIRDDGQCVLNSNNVEVFQYNTPLLVAIGPGTICSGQPVTMQIITGTGSIVNWLPPLSGNSLTQTVNSPGTYSCTVATCNINTPLSLDVKASNPVAHIIQNNPTACDGDTLVLNSDTASSYEWLPSGETTSSIRVVTSGVYTLKILDSLDCPASDFATVNFFTNFLQKPFTRDTVICQGELVDLNATGNNLIHWTNKQSQQVATGFSFHPGLLLNTTFYVLYSDSGGCRSEKDTLNITVDPCDTITIPNVITPNGDGKNDFFPDNSAKGLLFTIKIFNRWGKIVYDSQSEIQGWDGKNNEGTLLSAGTYYFVMNIKFLNGKVQDKHGFVEVIY